MDQKAQRSPKFTQLSPKGLANPQIRRIVSHAVKTLRFEKRLPSVRLSASSISRAGDAAKLLRGTPGGCGNTREGWW